MRSFVLTMWFLFFACSSKAETPTPAPLPTSTPTPSTTADPSPSSVPLVPAPSPGADSSITKTQQAAPRPVDERKIKYEGTWTVTDAGGPVFDIVVFKNGQAVTNWVKGPAGARGERGYWRADQQRLTIVYTNGCTDVIQPTEDKFSYSRYEAGSALDAKPIVQAEARRLENSQL